MTLPVSPELLLKELASAKDILDKWIQTIAAGIPMVDLPADEDRLEDFLRELCGEMLVVSGKCSTLAEVLYSSRG